jgi:HD-GYP domain-containing protein (c-di-GMP phosphodiesterase class II)
VVDDLRQSESKYRAWLRQEARILAVADVVEAMVSHRPHRPATGIDQALLEISKNKGILYDPEVVEACLTLFRKKGFGFEAQEALGGETLSLRVVPKH